MYVYIGSYALRDWVNFREPKDVDVAWCGIKPDIYLGKRVEYHEMPEDIIRMLYPGNHHFPTVDDLYTLKLSHIFWDIHHRKTISDVIWFQRQGARLNQELFRRLKEHWKEVHGSKKHISLNKSKEEFFDDYVKKEVDHDLIHEWVAKYDRPLYERCLKDGQEVLLDYDKFEKLDHDDKIHMIREEIMAIAIERMGIPSGFKTPSGVCFQHALSLTLTNLMKGKFADFAAMNLSEIASYKMTTEYLKAKEKFANVDN